MKPRSPLKTKPLRNPGQSVDEQIIGLLDHKLASYAVVTGGLVLLTIMEWYGELMAAPRQPILFTCAAVAAVVFTTYKVWRYGPTIAALKQGRDGERLVGQFLEQTRTAGARVLHDIPGDGFNLDHVIVSDRGVFVIETKTISKPMRGASISFDGRHILIAGRRPERDPIEQASAQIAWLEELLQESTGKRFSVRAALVYPNWWVDKVPKIRDIWVLNPKALPKYLENEPVRLTHEDVQLATFHLKQYVKSKC